MFFHLGKQAALVILEGLLGEISLSEISSKDEPMVLARLPLGEEMVEQEKAEPCLMVFDLETRNLAQDVGGWRNTHLMRVSVAVIYDSLEDRFVVYEEDRVDDLLAHLQKADLIVGFNVKRFDYRVLSAYTGMDFNFLPTFDILEDIYHRLGFRLSLDHLAKETLNKGKIADGLQAVEWFRNGEMEKLTEYCRQDVVVTRDLFEYGLKNGQLMYSEKRSNKRLRLLVDWKLDELLASFSEGV